MSSWGNYDNAANTPLWAVNASIVKAAPAEVHSAPTRANVTYLYANTTPDVFVVGQNVGVFGVDTTEQSVSAATANHPQHAGWVLVKAGSGRRAGRYQTETLVAMGSMTGDGSATANDDTTFADA